MEQKRIRILVVDVHELLRAGLGASLGAEPDMEIMAGAANGREAVEHSACTVTSDEVYQIAGEALRNAFRHAGAGRIEVEIHYAVRSLCLCQQRLHLVNQRLVSAAGVIQEARQLAPMDPPARHGRTLACAPRA